MTFRHFWRSLAVAVSLGTASFAWAAPANAATLPRLEADSLSGTHVVLPTDVAGKPLVLLLAFGKAAEGDVKAWSQQLLGPKAPQNTAVYIVVVADGHAFAGRRRILKQVAAAAGDAKEQVNGNVLVTFTGKGWRDLVSSSDKTATGLVVCDPRGEIVYAKQVRFNATNLSDVLKAAK